MAGRKKNIKQDQKGRKASKKRSIIIYGILLALVGILLVFISLFPSGMGVAGRFIDEKFLSITFGKASILMGLYCLFTGLFLLFVKKKIKYITGLTCLLIPSLIIMDVLLTAKTIDNNSEVEAASPIGHFLRFTLSDFIGNIGLVVSIIIVVLCGLFLLIPRPILSGLFKNFFSKLKKSKSADKESKEKVNETFPEKKIIASSAKDISNQSNLQSKTFSLNLELYDREFIKIPKGLFEEHITFNTDLPIGTRRQDIIDAFASFNIEVDIGDIKRGPSFEQYELIPGKSVKTSQIKNCIEDISLKIRQKVNIGKKKGSVLTLEVPLEERQVVPYGYLLEDTFDDKMKIPIAVGVDASFSTFSIDLVEQPHLLVAGTTGSGKSIFLKTLIASIMYHLTPNEVRLVLIDPKRVEFGVFYPSLFCACEVITEFEKVPPVFDALIQEMEKRYQLLEHAGCSDIQQFNASTEPQNIQPYIVVVIDEFAELIMQKVDGFEEGIIRLAQKARACGIHLVMATQRPSVDVIRGLLKTNIPGRIALSVSSQIDSRIIIDMNGAENLTGKGDLICICPAFREGIRLQGAYISKEEIQKIVAAKS
jgi:DNA segregation ATPase FtsK/SpoIIIE, S-DNA-T family